MNIDNLCRSCINYLTEDELKHVDDSAIKMYAYCTKIKINDLKEMPKYFCKKCSIQIKSSFKFIRKAQSVNDTYKHFIIAYKQKYPEDYLGTGPHSMQLENDLESAIKNLESLNKVDSATKILDEMAWNDNIENMPCSTEELRKIFYFISKLHVESDSNDLGMKDKVKTPKGIATNICNVCATEPTVDIDQSNTGDMDPNQANFALLPNFTEGEVNFAIENLDDTQDIDINETQDIDINNTEDIEDNIDPNLEIPPACDYNQKITFNCPYCEKSFSDNEESRIVDPFSECQHKNQLDSEDNNDKTQNSTKKHEPISCTFCRKTFNSMTWFNKHLKREHCNNVFKCDKCEKVYMSYSSWREHKKVHKSRNVNKDKICNVCNKHFRKKNHLEEHMVCHSDERPFACHLCDKKFKLKMVLIRHLAIHDNVKTKICHYCGKAFRDDRALNDHMVRHTGLKPFSCDKCDFRAQYRATLKRHKLRHSMIRAHVCQHCPKSFFTSDDLQRHARIHTGEKPYQCPYCPRSFAEHCKRKAHLVSQHHLLFEEIPRLNRDGSIYVADDVRTTVATTGTQVLSVVDF